MPRLLPPVVAFALAVVTTFAALALAAPARASAQELTPELASAGRRREAELELADVVTALPDDKRHALRGVYAAFDATPTDAYALAACDDDGDYVVVLSDALLVALEHFARATAEDDTGALARRYASQLASQKMQNARISPPPPGFFAARPAKEARAIEARQLQIFREALAFVVAREVVTMAAGDLTCASPTITREAGDAVWTPAERARSLSGAARVYGGRDHALRARAATSLSGAAGRGSAGASAWLTFVAAIEARSPSFGWAFFHPQLARPAE